MHMKTPLSIFILLAVMLGSVPMSAQFRRERNTANKQYELKAYNLAIESYKKALARRPSDLESLSRIADSYRMLNQMQTAHNYYQQAVQDRKAEGPTVLEHAHVLKSLGRYDEAKQWYLKYARDFDAVVGDHYAQSCDYAKTQQGVSAGFTVQSISANSPVTDFGATMPSPQQLVFNSARTNTGGAFNGQASNRPYVAAVLPDGGIQTAEVLQTGYNDPVGSVGPVSYTADGRQVLFTRNNFTAGTRLIPEAGINVSLMIADVNDRGQWVNPRPLPFNGTNFSTGFGTFSPDGNTIYFASDRPEGYGGYDVYRSRRQGGTWEAVPENVGTVVNSTGDELTPFFDGTSLFFSSDYHHGLGAFDVFRVAMTNGRPTTLYHMGDGVNSVRDDLGFVYDPITGSGFVTSNRIGGSGMEDVYRVGRAGRNKILVVQSAQDGSFLPNASVDFTGCGGQVYSTDANGRYVFESTEGLTCDIVIAAPGFTPVRLPVMNLQADADNNVRVALTPTGAPTTGTGTGTTTVPNTSVPIPGGPTPPGTYRGMVVNAQTGYPVPMATVRLTQRNTGATGTVFTNVDGAYILALNPNTVYDLEISGEGFATVRFPITNRDGSDPNLLGRVELLPGQSAGGNTGTVTNNTGGTTTTTTTTTSPTSTVSGYSVQLASLRNRPNLGNYSNVANLGTVYDVDTGSSYKVRLGVYASRGEAQAAAARAQAAGYNGAFVVADSGAPAVGGSAPTTAPTTVPVASSGRYKVQLGAYSKPENFNRNQAVQLGALETRTRGTLTLFMIGGLNSLADASSVRARARSMGYDGAFILEDVNGQLIKRN